MYKEYIRTSPYKIGSFFGKESLNHEFKKFTIDRDDIMNRIIDRQSFDLFFRSGKINNNIDENIKERLSLYLRSYIPKYTVCFFNTPLNNGKFNKESFLYIGINDDGIISGIPINPRTNFDEFYEFLLYEISKAIHDNLYNTLIPKDLIISCIEPYIDILDNSYTDNIRKKAEENKQKISDLSKEIESLYDVIKTKRKYVKQMQNNADQIKIGNFKQNPVIIERILKNLIENDEIPAFFDVNNKQTINFFFNLMQQFNTTNYDRQYELKLQTKLSVDEIMKNQDLTNALGTYFYLMIKKKSENHKKNLIEKYNNENDVLKVLELKLKKKLSEKANLFYDIESHFDKMILWNRFIVIKIKFDHEKYNHFILTENSFKLKHKRNDDELVSTIRTFKDAAKTDPECAIISKEKIII